MSMIGSNSSLVDCVVRESRSFFGEDRALLPVLLKAAGGRPGTFIEIGAFDGVALSNTIMLERCFGWRGELIEASTKNFRKLLRSGRAATLLHSAVCHGVGTVNLTTDLQPGFINGDPTSMSEKFKAKWFAQQASKTRQTESVPCEGLSSLVRRARGADADLSTTFLSLDVEGAEDTVLQTADLRSFQVVMVESDWSNRPKEESVERRLNAAGLIKSRRLRVRASRVFLRPELEHFLVASAKHQHLK